MGYSYNGTPNAVFEFTVQRAWKMRGVANLFNFQALKCLRRKKMLSESLAQKEKAIDKIHDLVDSIQQTESQKQVSRLIYIQRIKL